MEADSTNKSAKICNLYMASKRDSLTDNIELAEEETYLIAIV